jgi:hypothetical protein
MNRNDITKAFESLGGIRELTRWAKKNSRNQSQFYSMFHTSLLQADDAQHVEEDPEQIRAKIADALTRIIEAQRKGDQGHAVVYSGGPDVPLNVMRSHIEDGSVTGEVVSNGVTTPVVAGAAHEKNGRPFFCDDIPTTSHTSHHGIADTGMKDVAAPQALPEPKPSDGVTPKPKPDVVTQRDRPVRDKPRAEPVVGLCAAAVLGEGSAPDYGVNWSQSKAWY